MTVKDGRVRRISDDRRRGRWQIIRPDSRLACGLAVRSCAGLGSKAYPAANKALAYPFRVEKDFQIQEAWMESVSNGAGVHVDIGVYDHTYTKVATIGSTAWTNSTGIQTFSFSQLIAAGRYFAAIAMDSTGGGTKSYICGDGSGVLFRMLGCWSKTSAFALPSGTVTPSTYGDDNLPIFGFAGVTVV